jgi:hypothetical protein
MKLSVLASFLVMCAPADAATVVVHIKGVRNDHGHVLVALCTKADFLQPHCRWKGKMEAAIGTVTTFPPGSMRRRLFMTRTIMERWIVIFSAFRRKQWDSPTTPPSI